MMILAIFDQWQEFWRWLHILFGIVWIGMLYYFNFVQTEYFKEAEGAAKSDALQKLAPRALWWFRWGAAMTFLTGAWLMYLLWGGWDVYIALGALLGTLMAANVWFVIWPKQKIVIENARRTSRGEEPLPGAADALARAGCASRHNTLFSVPMLLFMVSSPHLGGPGSNSVHDPAMMTAAAAGIIIILLLELNALCGKVGILMMTSVRGVVIGGFVLSAVLAAVVQYL